MLTACRCGAREHPRHCTSGLSFWPSPPPCTCSVWPGSTMLSASLLAVAGQASPTAADAHRWRPHTSWLLCRGCAGISHFSPAVTQGVSDFHCGPRFPILCLGSGPIPGSRLAEEGVQTFSGLRVSVLSRRVQPAHTPEATDEASLRMSLSSLSGSPSGDASTAPLRPPASAVPTTGIFRPVMMCPGLRVNLRGGIWA